MRTLWLALLVAGVAGWSARAETSQQKGKRIVDEALAAVGGQAFLNMQNRVESGRIYGFYNEQLSGLTVDVLYTTYLPRPDPPVPGFLGVRVRDARQKKQDDVILYTDGTGYEITFRGARPLPDTAIKQFKTATLHNIFYILRQRLGEPGLIFDSRGSDFFENRPVEIVDISDANNDTVTVYFDQMTKLPVRQSFKRRNEQFKDFDTEVTEFAKYRDVGNGVKWPCTIVRQRNGEKIFEMYSDSVEVDKDLTDNLFTLPANAKMLAKPK